MPTPANASKRAMYWSADVGFAHVVSVNTDGCLLPAASTSPEQVAALEEQFDWLRADLAAAHANRARVPWIVMIGHEMMYSTHDAGHVAAAKLLRDGGGTCREGFEPLLVEFGVDLYFAGHEHVYERFKRTVSAVANASGTAHIVVGNAGNREFPYMNGSHVAGFAYDMPAYESYRAASPSGYGLLQMPSPSQMIWTQFSALTGKAIDTHTYERGGGDWGIGGRRLGTGIGEL